MKIKILIPVALLAFLTFSPSSAFAKNEGNRGTLVRPTGTKAPNWVGRMGKIVEGTLTSVNGTTLTLTGGGVTYTVDAAKTQIRARFWGSLNLSNLAVNDQLNIWGTWSDDAKTALKARLIRDLSIQRRHATFFGIVQTTNGTNSLTMTPLKRPTQTVTYVSGQIINHKEVTLGFSNLAVGDRIRVTGLWDTKANTVLIDTSQVKNAKIKDFGPQPSPTP